MRKLKLSQGKYALVDDNKYEELNQWKWHLTVQGYAARNLRWKDENGNKKAAILLLHRVLTGAGKGEIIDHANMNKLDNRLANLRHCTRAENMANSLAVRSNSGVRGISWNKSLGYWTAKVGKSKVTYHKTLEAATEARDKKAEEMFGEFARLSHGR